MTGREKVAKYHKVINILVKIMSIFPKSFLKLLWSMSSVFSGKIALLLRYTILRNITLSCGENVFIGPNVEIKNPQFLKVGDNVSIHSSCYIDAVGGISIGNDVSIAHQTSLVSFNHTWNDKELPIKYNPTKISKIIVDDDVWIGCGCRILAGVSIKSRSVIAAGSVVIKNVEPKSVVAGVPAKIIKYI